MGDFVLSSLFLGHLFCVCVALHRNVVCGPIFIVDEIVSPVHHLFANLFN